MRRKLSYLICLLLILSLRVAGQFISSNIPVVLIDTYGEDIQDEYRIEGWMQIISNKEGERNSLDSAEYQFDGKIEIEIRGNTSKNFPKKQFRIETQDTLGNNLNVSILGMPEENDWILYAPYSDKSLIRNALAYKLAADMGNYAPRTRFCELILNGDYRGIYMMTEKVKRDPSRVDISAMHSDDNEGDALTGGYIFSIDRGSETCPSWYTSRGGVGLNNIDPKCDEITPDQYDYCQHYFNSFERDLFSDHFTDPVNGYRSYINLNSFLDFFIVNELAKNIDAYELSTFMYKDRNSKGGKLAMGPVWDFNLGFGNADYRSGFMIDSIRALNYPWWSRFMEDPQFTDSLKARWVYHRENSLSSEQILSSIDSITLLLDESRYRNFDKWDILHEPTWPNYYVGSSYEEEVEYLKIWLMHRISWLDAYFSDPPQQTPEPVQAQLTVRTNPFDPMMTLEFDLEAESEVNFIFYNTMGVQMGFIHSATYVAGSHKITYYYREIENFNLKAGFYILIMKVDGVPVSSRKVLRY